MLVVSDTSPISNLAIIGRLDFLRRRYGRITIPVAVEAELRKLSHRVGKTWVEAAITEEWVVIDRRNPVAQSFRYRLDDGESAAINLAVALKADVLLVDEKRARAVARDLSVPAGGVLGELLYAKRAGWLVELWPEIKQLREKAGFFVDREIERFILSQAGE